MARKSAEHLRRTWERQPDLSQPDRPKAHTVPPADAELFDPLRHATHQESAHNKHNRPEAGPGRK